MEPTHVIIFHDRSKLLITNQDHENYCSIRKAGNKGIRINGCDYMFSAMAKIMTMQEFYDQYPTERPQKSVNNKFPTFDEMLNTVPSRVKFLRGVIEGLKGYINSTEIKPVVNKWGDRHWYQGTQAPIEMLKKMEFKLEQEQK